MLSRARSIFCLLATTLIVVAILPSLAGAGTARTRDDVPIPLFDHIILVIMENHSYDETRVAAYTAALLHAGTTFSNSHAVTHPSQPNYLALWSGTTRVTNDNCPPSGSPYVNQNLGHMCDVFGLRWRAYSEDLPAAGSLACSANGGFYVRKHAPWTDFSTSSHLNERPYTDFALDVAHDSLPALSVIVPNICDDGHNTCDGDPVDYGDAWLSRNVPAMLQAVGPHGLFILTWDEDDNGPNNHILTAFVSPYVVPDTTIDQHITHYTVLRTICEGLGMLTFAAADAETSITGIWLPEAASVHVPPAHPLSLSQPRPNPARGGVIARLSLPARTPVRAEILDVRGVRVRVIGDGEFSGEVDLNWDGKGELGRPAPGGVYFMRVSAAGQTVTRKMVRLE